MLNNVFFIKLPKIKTKICSMKHETPEWLVPTGNARNMAMMRQETQLLLAWPTVLPQS